MKKNKTSKKKLTLDKLNITRLDRKGKSTIGGNNIRVGEVGDSNSLDGGNTTMVTITISSDFKTTIVNTNTSP